MTYNREWEDLKYGKIKRILIQEISFQEWFQDAYGNPDQARTKLDSVVDKIMEEFRLYCQKLENDIHKRHHED